MITLIPRRLLTFLLPNQRVLVSWKGEFQLFAGQGFSGKLFAMAVCFALAIGSCGLAAQSTTPDSHAADTQSDKPKEGGQPSAVGGVNTGAAHPAVFDKEHRPITAGGFVKDGPVLFQDIALQAGLTAWKHTMDAGKEIHHRSQWIGRLPAGL